MGDQTSFDLDAWITQGETALQRINAKLQDLDTEREKLEGQKQVILQAMGRNTPETKPSATPSKSKTKVMVRPAILEALLQAGSDGLTLEQIVDKVQEEKPDAPYSSIETSVVRLARLNPAVVKNGERWAYQKANGASATA